MLVDVFLAQAGAAFLKKAFNNDDLGGDNKDKSATGILATTIGTFIGSLFSGVAGNMAHDKVKSISDKLQRNNLPVNHDIHRCVRKAFICAAAEVARHIIRTQLYSSKDEKKCLKLVVDYCNGEIKKFDHAGYIPEEDNPANKAYSYLANNLSQLLSQQVSEDQLKKQLFACLLYELDYHVFVTTGESLPGIYQQLLESGWQENEKPFSFFLFMCDYFHEFIKEDTRLRAIMHTEWITQILSDTGEIKSHLERLHDKFEAVFKELGAGSIMIQGKLDEILLVLKPQPKLIYKYKFDESRQTLFRHRYLNFFIGRDEEMSRLTDFFDNPKNFSWWLITGPGGSGKSRLALEFCHELSYHKTIINMGFSVNPASLFKFNWDTWQPLASTLIIIDYASGHYERIIGLLQSLSQRQEEFIFPVRLLLLERKANGTWWEEIQKEQGHTITVKMYDSPLSLNELGNDNLWQIFEKVFEAYHLQLFSKVETLDKLRKIDDMGRPLFAWFVAIALAEGKTIRDWNVNDLLQYQLDREEGRIYESLPGGRSNENKTKVRLVYNLVMLATMTAGLTHNDVHKLLESHYDWLPVHADESFSATYSCIAGVDGLSARPFLPLEPDILGEFFVLNQFNVKGIGSSTITERNILITKLAWQLNPEQMALFTIRVFSDFPKLPAKDILLLQPGERDTTNHKLAWAIAIRAVIDKYSLEKEFARADGLFGLLRTFAIQTGLLPIWIELSWAAYNMTVDLNGADLSRAVFFYEELEEIAVQYPHEKILLNLRKAAYNFTTDFDGQTSEQALFYYKALKKMAVFDGRDETWVLAADALKNVGSHFAKQDVNLALPYYEELQTLALTHPNPEISLEIAKATYNIFFGFMLQDVEKALPYYKSLKDMSNHLQEPAVWLLLSKAAFKLAMHFNEIDINLALPYADDLKYMALSHPQEQIKEFAAVTLSTVVTRYAIIDQAQKGLEYFKIQLLPLYGAYDSPTIAMEVITVLGFYITFGIMPNGQFEAFKELFMAVWRQYQSSPIFQKKNKALQEILQAIVSYSDTNQSRE